MTTSNTLSARIFPAALALGLIGLAATGIGAVFNLSHSLQSYLLAFFYWTGLSLGALGLLLLQYVTGGAWGWVTRRVMEAASLNVIVMALLAIPFLAGMSRIYVWTAHPSIHVNIAFLNIPCFIIRTAIMFAIWAALSLCLRRWSLLRDGGAYRGTGPETVSGFGLVLFVLTVTLATIDWIMSLEPDWYSTIFGVLVMVGQASAALSIAIIVLHLAVSQDEVSDNVVHDLGNLMLMFVLLWGYMAFSQYLIVWSGNLPDETAWYLHRRAGGWPWVANMLIVFYFAVPFFLLLFRAIKRKKQRLYLVACGVLAMHFVDCYWLIMPAFRPEGPAPRWQDGAAMIGIGGIWVAALSFWLNRAPLFAKGAVLTENDTTAAAGETR